MHKLYLPLLLCFSLFATAQYDEIEAIAEAEMKAAGSFMELAVNPNTLNYDLTYHKLELTIDPDVAFISGKVTSAFTALSAMSTVTFDLMDPLTVSSVKRNNINLAFSQSATELTINFPTPVAAGVSTTIEITYSGVPQSTAGSIEFASHSGTPLMWTLSEPFGARDWWPCKQDLNDKIDSIDVYITSPSAYIPVSNGVQQSVVDNGNGTKTTHFHHGHPIPAYLIAVAVTNYTIFNQQAGFGTPESPFFPIVNYLYPESAVSAQTSLAVTPAIMNFFEEKFGPYPFRDEKYGHAQCGFGGGMEHTTVSFMGGFSRGLIAHELGHQWFGDKVTCGTWKDIWLNEGFASYLALMIIEDFDGDAAFVNSKNGLINNITSQPGGALYLTDTEATNIGRIFSSRLSYNKGCMVVNMLRFKLGDEAFFDGLMNYLNDPLLAYSYAITPQLQSHLEAASGMDLEEFFLDWVYRQGYPTYDITAQNIAAGQAQVTVNQTQSHMSVDYFEMPVPVRLLGEGGQELDVVLENMTQGQQFIVDVPFVVTGVVFDPNKDLISKNNTTSLGVASITAIDAVSLYPNPTSDRLNISLPESVSLQSVAVFNTLGQQVLQSASASLDVSQLSVGMHLVKVQTDAGTKTLRFVKL